MTPPRPEADRRTKIPSWPGSRTASPCRPVLTPESVDLPSGAIGLANETYDYVRPLATVEPTAIFFKLSVDTSFGFSDIIDLQAALEKRLTARRDTLILIAWEHKQIEALVKGLLDAHGG